MMFLKQKYAALVMLFIITGSTTGLAQGSCMQNFLRISQYNQQFLEISQNASKRTGTIKGSVFIVGRNTAWSRRQLSEILGGIYYTIRGESLRVNHVIDRPELRGGDIFYQLFQKLLAENQQIKKISMNIGSHTMSLEKMNEIATNPSIKPKDNSVTEVFDRLGLQIERAQVIPVGQNQSLVLVLSAKKFNEEYTEH
jgi:hypothetical protein